MKKRTEVVNTPTGERNSPYGKMRVDLARQIGMPTIRPLEAYEKVSGALLSDVCAFANHTLTYDELVNHIKSILPNKDIDPNESNNAQFRKKIKSFTSTGNGPFNAPPSAEVFSKAIQSFGDAALIHEVHRALVESNALSGSAKEYENVVYEESQKDARMSTWGIYTALNLAGISAVERNIPKQAVRFSHLLLGEKTEALGLQSVQEAVVEIFKDENRFKWINKLNEATTEDPRLNSINFPNTEVYELKKDGIYTLNKNNKTEEKIQAESMHTENSHTPVVCIIDHDVDQSEMIEMHAQISRLLDHNPFVILLNNEGENRYVGHMFTNHEFMDGIPASYYLRKFFETVTISVSDLSNKQAVPDGALKTILKTADDIENSFANPEDKRYRLHTDLLDDNSLENVTKFYTHVKSNLEKAHLTIDPNTFMQLVLLDHAGVNGDDILGGALRFNWDRGIQLEHYSVGPIQKIMKVLNKDSINADDVRYLSDSHCLKKRRNPKTNIDDEVVVLYNMDRDSEEGKRGSKENIGQIIGAVRKMAPPSMWSTLNDLTKFTGAARALSGQAMASLIPAEMIFRYATYDEDGTEHIHKKTIILGGVGGPAVTEFQDVGYTIFVDYDEERDEFTRIIVRQKAYKNSRDEEAPIIT